MRTLFLKVVSLFVVLTLIINILPLNAFASTVTNVAANTQNENQTQNNAVLSAESIMSDDSLQMTDAFILYENEEKRSEFSKDFLLSNGLSLAAVYPYAVHFEEDGQWKEIDHTLTSVVERGTAVYKNRAGAWDVYFPQTLTSQNSISVSKDGYKLSFGMAGELRVSNVPFVPGGAVIASVAGDTTAETFALSAAQNSIAQIQETNIQSVKQGSEFPETACDKASSRLLYADVYSNTSIIYDLLGNQIKESIIIRSYDANLRGYRYALNTGSMIPVLQEDGSIVMYTPDRQEVVFTMPAPYMVDSNGEYSGDVDITLSGSGGNYTLTYILPTAWLAEEDRAWPVILDPIVNAESSTSNIADRTVAEERTLASNWGMNACGYRDGWGVHRFYMKFINLPALNSADDIIYAEVTLYDQYDPDTYSIVEVHGVTETWTSSGMTWSNKPNHVDAVTDYVKVTAAGYYSFDVTDLAHGWYTGENTGMVFKMSDEVEQSGVDDWKQFYSCEFGAIKPTLQITYRNTNGIEAYWDYTTLPAGRAGEGYVQNYTGNLMWVHNDMGFAGNRMPVSISHIFSANDAWDYLNNTGYNPFGLGNGWRTNFNQTIEQATTSTGDIYYIWEDGDGTSHEFWLASNGQYADNDDLGLTLTVTSDGYRISDKQENTSTFDAQGRLTRQSDNQNIASTNQNIKNEIKITYQSTTSKLISQIQDGVNRKYTFNYNNGLLEQISFYGTGSSVLSTIRFTYVNSNLATITYADGLKTQFVYTTKNMLSSVTNIDGYRVSLTYSSLDLKKPSKVTSIVDDYVKTTQTAQGGTTTFSYGHRYTAITKVSQNAGAEDVTYTHYFNEWGNTISIQDGEGNAVFYQYDTDISASGTKNRLQAASKEIGTTVNLLKDTSFEKGTLWAPSAGSTTSSISTAEKLDGSKSIKSTCSQEYGGVSGASCGTFTVAAGEAVTFSAYMKTIGGQARLRITDNNNLRIDSEWLDSNTDWTRLEVTYKNTSSAVRTITVSVCHVTPGSAYVDCVQLEKNQTASSYNMATDSDISSGVGGANSAWSRYSGNTTYPSVSSMDSVANLDRNVISIDGDLGVKKYAYQTITFPGKAGDRYILSGWTTGEALPSTHVNFFYGLILVFNYTNGRQQEVKIHANPTLGNNGQWQYLAMPAIAEEAYSSITIRAENSYNDNVVYFDGLQLYKEEFGETYTYDSASGNLTVVRDAAGLETKYSYYSNNDLKDVEQPSGVKVLYSDYSSHNPEKITTTAPDGDDRIVISTETYEYDTYGNVLKHTVTYDNVSKTTSASYTESGNQLYSTTDELGKITRYEYDPNTGVLNWVKYPNNTATTRTNYVYDSMYRLVSTNMTNSDGKQLSATYTYDKDNITRISTKSTVYNFVYGDFSLRSQVSIGSSLLTRYEYTDDENKNLSLLEYGNGHVVKYSYDDLGRLLQEQYLDENDAVVRTITYTYNNSGVLATMTDSKTGVTTKYHYDHAGRALGATETVNGKAHGIWYTYNGLGQLKQMREVYGDTSVHTDYVYDGAGRLAATQSGNSTSIYTYDSFNRIAQQQALHGTTTVLIQDITYKSPASNSTSSQIEDWHCYNGNNFNLQFSYTYDANGNILSVTSQGKTTRYFYDSANQLIEERNAAAGKAWAWTYDDAGNITSRTERSYVNDSLGSIMNVTNYQYENGAWGDLLDTYGGVNIDHDAIGNLVDDGTWEYTWTQGRMLARMERKSNSSSYWEFTYDANGMRTKRHSSEGTYTYVYNGGLLSRMGYDGVELRFTYDASGKPLTVTYSGATYYYVLNLQGDVVAILNSSGTAVVTYTYDAWGIILDTTDSTATVTTGTGAKLGLGALNPLRYRGYVYDRETGLYYLQSRYYNPTWGRFISADNVIPDAGGEILGYNLFAYCMNNPVNYSDQGGNWPSWATKLLIGTAVIAAAAILTVATAGTGTALACFAVGALKGAAIGAAVGAASGAATGAITHRITTGSWEGAGQAALEGAADGYMMGAITGFISGGLTSNVCFVAGTSVLTAGGYTAIEDIISGDYVWAADPETGEAALKQVVQTFVNEATELVHVTVKGEEIVCTTEHPFYSPVKGWTAACKLRAGDILVTVNGEYVVVEKVQHEILESPVKVYNFEVENFHTYYVSNIGVLVHNVCSKPSGSYEIFTSNNRVYVGKGSEARMHASMRRLQRQGFDVVNTLWESAPNSSTAFVNEYMKMAKYNFDFGGVLINKIMSPGFKIFSSWL